VVSWLAAKVKTKFSECVTNVLSIDDCFLFSTTKKKVIFWVKYDMSRILFICKKTILSVCGFVSKIVSKSYSKRFKFF
jgi:hypothetical protein